MNPQNAIKEGIIAAINPIGGISKTTGNAWSKTIITLDFSSPDKVRKLDIPFWGQAGEQLASDYKVGERVRIAFDVEGREWQGHLYPEVTGYLVERVETQSQQAAPQQPVAQTAPAQQAAPAQQPTAEEGIPF